MTSRCLPWTPAWKGQATELRSGFHVQGGVDIHKMFGLSGEEELMESFEVELRQTYACNHNALSKPQEVGQTTMHLSMLYPQFNTLFKPYEVVCSMQHPCALMHVCLVLQQRLHFAGCAAEWVIRGACVMVKWL
jgi:hypothetical protein